MLENIKVNDRVKSVISGWGTVAHNYVNLVLELSQVCVRFDNGQVKKFCPDGRHRKDDLNPEIVEVVPSKWYPKEGNVDLHGDGKISELHEYNYAIAGRSYQTESQAMIARRLLTPIQRQLTWLFEHCPDYNPEDENNRWYIYYDYVNEMYDAQHESVPHKKSINVIYMPIGIACTFCDELNLGRVDLWDY